MFEILEKEVLNSSVTRMKIYAPYIAAKSLPGQFLILRVDKIGERIPLTIFDYDRTEGTIDIIYQKVGMTTLKLDKKNKGEIIEDVVGPLGKPTDVKGFRKVIIVSGGVGSAIAYPVAKKFKEVGTEVEIISGFRSKELIILENEMKKVDSTCIVVTDDGSNGKKGLVTDVLSDKLEKNSNCDLVFTVGPIPMMRAVCNVTKGYNVKTVVSMTSIMIDGTGMCGGCRLTVGGDLKFACVDGPEFDGHKVDFEEATVRNIAFKDEERLSKENYCNLFKGV